MKNLNINKLKSSIKRTAYLLSRVSRKQISMTYKVSEQILNDYYAYSGEKTCITDNRAESEYDLHIIIPAYNSEDYILDCLQSILEQRTEYSFFVTVVNDGSTDNTREIIEKFIFDNRNKINIQLINQNNLGFSEARNSALKIIRGDYVTFIDSDDLLAPNAIQALLHHAVECNADIVQGGWNEFYKNKSLNDYCRYAGYPWAKVYKADLLKNFKFPSDMWFEDTAIWLILVQLDVKIELISNIVYKYRKNKKGITATYKKYHKAIDTLYITKLCIAESILFGVKYSDKLYRIYLKQFITNWYRTNRCPRQIRKAIFVQESHMLKKYFSGCRVDDPFLNELASSLKRKNFTKFELLSFSYSNQ